MDTGEMNVAVADEMFEQERRELELAEKYRTYVTTISALVIITGSAVLLLG